MTAHRARIVLEDGHLEREATVEIDADHPQATVAELAAHLGLEHGEGLVVDGEAFEPTCPLGDIGLADGTTLSSTEASISPRSPSEGAELVAIGGAATGCRWRLHEGITAIGPGRGLAVRLDGVQSHEAIAITAGRAVHVTASGTRPLACGQPIMIGEHLLRVTTSAPMAARPIDGTTIPVRPIPRRETVPPASIDRAPVASSAPVPPTLSWVSILAPLVMGAVIALLWSPRFALLAAFGPVLAIGTWLEQRRRFRRQRREYDEATACDVAAEAHRERDERRRTAEAERLAHPDHATVTDLARRGGPRLWSGAGPIWLSFGWQDDHPHRIAAGGRSIGLVGDRTATSAVAARGLLQLAADRPPSQLAIDSSGAGHDGDLAWLRWLPHRSGANGATNTTTVFGPDERPAQPPSPEELQLLLVDAERDLPPWTDTAVVLTAPGRAVVFERSADRQAESTESGQSILTAPASTHEAERIARLLARWQEVDPGRPPTGAVAGLADLVGPLDDDGHRLGRWQGAEIGSLPAPIGATAAGPLTLDLVSDGPHAVIGGTTGSGKSELLRTLVASMCAGHPPDLLHFVLVDYKGGSAFDGCRDLPHVATVVTDLDGNRTRRVLAGIQAELSRREQWLRDRSLSDLRAAPVTSARPARLVVVIDEFATMLQEHPDQVAVLVDVARRGRSLGLHLILATQRPAGAMTDDIRANVDLRIALRMVDPSDSVDVLGAADAARLPADPPGQALIRRAGSALEACRVALSTAPWMSSEPVVVRWADGLAPDAGSETGEAPGPETAPSQLDVLVACCNRACSASGQGRAQPLWPDDLPDNLDPNAVPAPETAEDIAIGLIDDLRRPVAVPLGWPRAGGLLALHGGPRAELPTVLGGIVSALVHGHEAAHVYAIACDQALTGWAGADAVGAVATSDDRAAVGRVLDRLERLRRLESDGRPSTPVIVIVHDLPAIARDLDDLHGLDLLDRIHRRLLDRSRPGTTAIVTTARPGAVPTAVAGAIDRTLIGRVAQPDDYRLAGLDPPNSPLGAGRVLDESGREVQLVTVDRGDLARRLALPLERRPPPLDELPPVVTAADMHVAPAGTADLDRWLLPVGRSVEGPAALELPCGQIGLVAGPPGSGRTVALRTLAAMAADQGLAVVCIDGREDEQRGGDGHRAALAALAETCIEESRAGPTLLLIDNAEDLPDHEGLLRSLSRGQTRPDHLRTIVALDPLERRTGYSHWTGAIGRSRSGIALHHDLDHGRELWSATLPPPTSSERPPGRGLLVTGSATVEIQVMHVDP